MKVLTSTLKGRALDWAVSTALGRKPWYQNSFNPLHAGWYEGESLMNRMLGYHQDRWECMKLIEQHVTEVVRCGSHSPDHPEHKAWFEVSIGYEEMPGFAMGIGDTLCEAVCRCFVNHTLGKEVNLPDNLKEYL